MASSYTFKYILKGALTNKPFAFNFRAWELEVQKSFNFFDVFCEDVLVELRGLAIVRVLPNVKDLLAFNWITDKVRFFVDSLQYQRSSDILLHLQKNQKVSAVRLEWRYLLSFFNFWLAKIRMLRQQSVLFLSRKVSKAMLSYDFLFNVNFNTDILDVFSFSQLTKRVGGGFLFSKFKSCVNVVQNNFLKFNVTSLQSFFMSFSVQSLLLVDVDLRFDFPKLHLLLKSLKKRFQPKIFSCGVRFLGVHDLEVYNLGLSFSTFVNFIRGSDLVNNVLGRSVVLQPNVSNLCIFGSGFLNRMSHSKLADLFSDFCSRFNFKVLRLEKTVSDLNVKLFNVRNVRLSFKNYFSLVGVKSTKGFLFDSSNTEMFVNGGVSSFLYCHVNPFSQVNNLDCFLQLPCSSVYERGFLHMNLFGKLKESFKYVRGIFSVESSGVVEQRPLFKFFNVVSDFNSWASRSVKNVSEFFKFLDLKPELRTVVSSTFRVLPLLLFVAHFKLVRNFLLYGFVFNFYKVDEFSRNSLVLSVTSQTFSFFNYFQ